MQKQVFNKKLVDQSFEDFFYRFIQAENLRKAQKGIVFVGNTRAGKSTLTCAAAGSRMELYHDSLTGQAEILPCDQKFDGLVTTSLESVTEKPNFFEISNNRAVIDMPGYADSSRFRELINFHYITTMISNLKQVRFVMVIGVATKSDGFSIDKHELKMMQSFMEMFPNCKEYVTLIVNKFEPNSLNNFQYELKNYLNKILVDDSMFESMQKSNEMRDYYREIVKKLTVVKRPPYKPNLAKSSKKQQHSQIGKLMEKICSDINANFISSQKLLKQTKFTLFKYGDTAGNQKIEKKIEQILTNVRQVFSEGLQIYKKIIVYAMENILHKTNHRIFRDILEPFMNKHKTNLYDRQTGLKTIIYHMPQPSLVGVYSYILNFKSNQCDNKAQIINNLFSNLLSLAQFSPEKNELLPSINYFYSFLLRCLQIVAFILKLVPEDSPSSKAVAPHIHTILDPKDIKNYLEVLNQIHSFKPKEELLTRKLFKQLIKYFFSLDIKKKFDRTKFDENHKQELIKSYQLIKKNYKQFVKNTEQSKEQDQLSQEDMQIIINKKIKQVGVHFLLHSPIQPPSPSRAQSPEINNSLKQLLRFYPLAESKEIKFKVALRIAAYLQLHKDYKKAIGLLFQLELYEKVMTMLATITQARQCKQAEALDWYYQFAMEFEAKKRLSYFQLCLEKAKSNALENPEILIDLHYRFLQGRSALSKAQLGDFRQTNTLEERLQLWPWQKIDEEINLLRCNYKLGNTIPKNYGIVARRLRYN